MITILLLVFTSSFSQNIGIGTTTPNIFAKLDIADTATDLLIPRMTKAQRDAITTPATSLLIYQTNDNTAFYSYNGTAWKLVNTESQLEKIIEGGNTGHRILGRNAANYGDIGLSSVDLLLSQTGSNLNGATGFASFATGENTKASGYNNLSSV
jgi:hypothetical protein